MSAFPHQFPVELAAVTRLDGPVGSELRRVESDFEALRADYTAHGSVDASTIEMLRAGLDRLDTQGKLLAVAEGLMEHAGIIRRLVEELANDQQPGAIERIERHMRFQKEQIEMLLEGPSA